MSLLVDTRVGAIVTIEVDPSKFIFIVLSNICLTRIYHLAGPYGLNLVPDMGGNAAVISNWERLPDGTFGKIQLNGGVVTI